ncbi:protein LBH-like [Parambassis ranga]|uniref:Protein LBH-like n=1 Tax=Parambassis ranga TaxID=210632 RepID=A0A6P7HBB0_9TELE|nr:protein LBH-like [Parambassis ranga]
MTNQVMNTCDSTVGGASGDDAESIQVFPKPLCHLPSIVVETMDGGEVESGELRWPPGDVSSDITEEYTQVTAPVKVEEPQEQVMGGV